VKMSTEHMPPTQSEPTAQARAANKQPQANPAAQQAPPESAPLPLGEDMARIIESQADVIAQQQVYHSQMLMGVSALGTDPVNARNAALVIANALRNNTVDRVVYALVNLGYPQVSQVNDRTLPYRLNPQVAGLFEGLLFDAMSRAYRDDPERLSDARSMLDDLFQRANEQANTQPKTALSTPGPGRGPNPQS
jgi:hypothetical protein